MSPSALAPPRLLRTAPALLALGLALAACPSSNGRDPPPAAPVALRLVPHLGGAPFAAPVWAQQAPGGPPDWFVVEQDGRVWRVDDAGRRTLFLDLTDRVVSGGEQGLLGLAFDPDWPATPQLYVSYTAEPGGQLTSRISRLPAGPDGRPDPGAETVLLALAQPFRNHNGGQIAFGPDGYLYAGFGDGGSAGDPGNRAQDLGTLLGKMLRLHVRGQATYAVPADNPFAAGGGRPEIYAWGLRNPWRWSFDREGGALWVADVGQNAWEEVNRVVRGGNYGWRIREGRHCFDPLACDPAGLVDPVTEYGHDRGCSVTGGYVYRGAALPSLRGTYVFGDYCSGAVFAVPSEGTGFREPALLLDSEARISSFAEGRDGELYVVDHRGGILRLAPAAP